MIVKMGDLVVLENRYKEKIVCVVNFMGTSRGNFKGRLYILSPSKDRGMYLGRAFLMTNDMPVPRRHTVISVNAIDVSAASLAGLSPHVATVTPTPVITPSPTIMTTHGVAVVPTF